MRRIFLHQYGLMGTGVLVAGGYVGLQTFPMQDSTKASRPSICLPKILKAAGVSAVNLQFSRPIIDIAKLGGVGSLSACGASVLESLHRSSAALASVFPISTVSCDDQSVAIDHSIRKGSSLDLALPKRNVETVVLHDIHVTTESIVHRGCHIFFSWTLFASLWASVVAFPVVLALNIAHGAWAAVASIAALWAGSLAVSLPPSDEFRRFILRGLHKWFPYVDIIYEQEPAVHKTMFCCHPHGAFSVGAAMLLDDLNYRRLPDGGTRKVAIVAAPFLRWCNPIFKIVTDLTGIDIHGAGRREFRELLDSGQPCALIPGGFSEATITCVGRERIYINDRKGFVKYALRTGYSLTPVYVFGESDMYHNPQGMWRFRLYLNSLRFQLPAVLPFGYPLAPLAPRRVPVRVVCGPALELPLIANPTDQDVDMHHARYVAAVEELFYRNVNSYHEELYCKYNDAKDEASRVLERW